ncbi:bifunctional protein pyrR [Mycobacterium kansasii 732]|nr:bifunctional protein pyrR [Mycobacterium kansasii 732]
MLLGIPTRGVTLARRLATHIREYSGVEVAHGALDITLYRDDLMSKPPRPLEETSIPAGGIDDALVILVDDVLYSGRSVRSALDALRDVGRPARCSWPSWSTAATGNCRCAPITSARTCRPPAARACTCSCANTTGTTAW